MPETVQPATTANNKSLLGALYLNSNINIPNSNIPVCSSDSFVQDNLQMLLNKKLNDKIYTTFKATFSNVNLDSVSKVKPKVHKYNNEINKFVMVMGSMCKIKEYNISTWYFLSIFQVCNYK